MLKKLLVLFAIIVSCGYSQVTEYTICSTGGADYASETAFEAAFSGNFAGLGIIRGIGCAETTSGISLLVLGQTNVSPANHIEFWGPNTHSMIPGSSGNRIMNTTLFDVRVNYTIFRNYEISNTSGAILATTVTMGVEFRKMVYRAGSSTSNGILFGTGVMFDSVVAFSNFAGHSFAAFRSLSSGGTLDHITCDGFDRCLEQQAGGTTSDLTNSIIINAQTDAFELAAINSQSHNLCYDNTGKCQGTGSQNNISDWGLTDIPNNNYTPLEGSIVIGAASDGGDVGAIPFPSSGGGAGGFCRGLNRFGIVHPAWGCRQ